MVDLAGQLPSSLRKCARWERLGGACDIPALLVHPTWNANDPPAPVVIWMHGRTVNKETDPGRYLRWLRAGMGACAVDLPGHGERFDETLQQPHRTFEVLTQMLDEIDVIVEALGDLAVFDMNRSAIGGMSAGGMTALARLCSDHPFVCASVEATSGSWAYQRDRAMFADRDWSEAAAINPIDHLESWREIPFQAIHARHDESISFEGQAGFIAALRAHYADPELIEFVEYDHTGAPFEHAGFGRMAADAKNRQRDFFARCLRGA